VRLKVLGAYGSEGQGQRPSAFLVDDTILIDAGTVGGALTVPEQIAIDHAVLSHGHLDHVAGLAYLTDTLAMAAPNRPVTCWSIAPVIEALSEHAFNDRLWPNFRNIPSPAEPVLALRVVTEEVETRVGHVSVTPVPVDHTVPAAGYIVHDGSAGFVYTGDTGPTGRIWQVARSVRGLKALVVETAFPNRLAPLAKASGHLTPDMLRQEIEKMPDLPVWIFHIKPQLYEETVAELEQIDPTRIHILEQGKTYNL
jgi:cAMP phosphodiesterase